MNPILFLLPGNLSGNQNPLPAQGLTLPGGVPPVAAGEFQALMTTLETPADDAEGVDPGMLLAALPGQPLPPAGQALPTSGGELNATIPDPMSPLTESRVAPSVGAAVSRRSPPVPAPAGQVAVVDSDATLPPASKPTADGAVAAPAQSTPDALQTTAKTVDWHEQFVAVGGHAPAQRHSQRGDARTADPGTVPLDLLSVSRPVALQADAASKQTEILLPETLQSPKWSSSLANRVAWMVNGNIQQAQMHINPPELGPMEVQVRVKDGDASIAFISHHHAVRDALESAMPRLQQVLQDQGFAEVNVDIGGQQQSPPQDYAGNEPASSERRNDASAASTDADAAVGSHSVSAATMSAGDGLVDTFA